MKAKRKNLPVADIKIDSSYQRNISASLVKEGVENFQEDLFLPINVNIRPNGDYYCYDGGNRLAMARALGRTTIDAIVVEGNSPRWEAHQFRELNRRRNKPQPIDDFKAAVREGDTVALGVKKVVEKHGFEITYNGQHDGLQLQCVVTLCTTYVKHGPGLLSSVFDIVAKAWPPDESARGSNLMVGGIATLLSTFGKAVDKDRAVAVLTKFTPRQLTARAHAIRVGARIPLRKAFMVVVMELYNHKIRGKKRLTLPLGRKRRNGKKN